MYTICVDVHYGLNLPTKLSELLLSQFIILYLIHFIDLNQSNIENAINVIFYDLKIFGYAYPHKTMSHLSMSPIEKDLKMLLPDLTSSCSILNSIAVADPFRVILCFLVSVKKD